MNVGGLLEDEVKCCSYICLILLGYAPICQDYLQVGHRICIHFWINDKVIDAQITQTLKFKYAQYMGNHRKNIFWPLTLQHPNCTLCHKNDIDTWPHLLSTCEHPYLKGLRIARHNKAIHLITQTLQANKNTRYSTLTNA